MVLEAGVSWPILIGAAVIDSINPCAFGVLIFLLAYLTKTFKDPKRMLIHGLTYIFAVFLTYLAAGLILLPIIRQLTGFSTWAYWIIAGIIIIAGLLELKDLIWYGKGFSLAIRPSDAERIKMYVKRISTKLSTAFSLGVFVALVELPCTGAVYLAVLTLMSFSGVSLDHITMLVLYNIIFVLPLIVILVTMYRGVGDKKMHAWREKHKKLMRAATGLLLIGMGIWMIWFTL